MFIEVADEQKGFHYEMRFTAKKKNQTSVKWVVSEIDSSEVEKSFTPPQVQTKLRENLQRLEPLEERLSIYFDNLSVKVDSNYNRVCKIFHVVRPGKVALHEIIDRLYFHLLDIPPPL